MVSIVSITAAYDKLKTVKVPMLKHYVGKNQPFFLIIKFFSFNIRNYLFYNTLLHSENVY